MFITHGWYQTRWWAEEVAERHLNCSDVEMIDMLSGVIAVQQFPVARNGSLATASGLVSTLLYNNYLCNVVNRCWNKRQPKT